MSTMIQDFQKVLREKGFSEWTRQAYVSDVRSFLKFSILSDLDEDNLPELAGKYLSSLQKQDLATTTIKRREVALRLFAREVMGVELQQGERPGRVVKVTPVIEDTDDIWTRIGLPTLKVPYNGDWMKYARCDDSDLMFNGRKKEEAKAVCATCPVKEQCLQHALDNEIEHGVWGGKDENERKELLGRYVRVRK